MLETTVDYWTCIELAEALEQAYEAGKALSNTENIVPLKIGEQS